MARILVSAGHTVMDPGAVFRDLREVDLTRKIAPKIISSLQAAGQDVQGVPLDLPLWQRIEWINNTGYSDVNGDLLIEVHINDSDGTKRGLEAWYLGNGGNNSQKFAHTVVETIKEVTGYESQGVKSEYEHEHGSLTFLNRSNPAAVLLETLFIDNEEDIKLLKNDQKLDELAKAISKGILRYLGKDETGKELSEDLKPKYDDLKPYEGKKKSPSMPWDMGDDDDLLNLDGMNSPVNLPTPTLPSTSPAAMLTPPTPNFGATSSISAPNFPSFPTPSAGIGNLGGMNKPGNNNFMMDREQRKDMIEKTYVKILGRKPSQSDLNYFLNMGISESDLIKKMMDSQEHVDMIKAKQKVADLEAEVQKKTQDLQKLSTTANDQRKMLENLNHLLAHKNQAIAHLERVIQEKYGLPSSVVLAQQGKDQPKDAQSSNFKYKQTAAEKVFSFFSRKML